MDKIKTILMLGKPGSGKGTQAALLAEETGYEIFSSGGRFREIATEDTYLGRKVKETIDNGMLMPAWYPIYILNEKALSLEEDEGIVFEGSSRTLAEGMAFHEVMTWLGRPYKAFHLKVNEEEVIKRIVSRNQGREDDAVEKLQTRFAEYERHTAPAIEFIRSTGNLVELDGMQQMEVVHDQILRELNL